MAVPRDSTEESGVPSALLTVALAAAAGVTAAARCCIAILAGGGNVAAGGQNQGGNGKREENQRAAGHVFLQGFLIRQGPKQHRFQQAGSSEQQGRFCGGTVNLRFVTLFQ